MKHFIFCHGFGFDKSFWDNLSPYFGQEKCSYLDLGYFEKPCKYVKSCGDQVIGIAHSLGLLKLLNLSEEFDYLIGLNSFINFLGNESKLRKKRGEELDLLKKHFTQSPLNTLKRFYQRCGITSFIDIKKINKISIDKMLTDLDFLSMSMEVPKSTSILIIGSEDDPIVPPVILHDNFDKYLNVRLEIIPKGKHSLGFWQIDEVHRKIMDFIGDPT